MSTTTTTLAATEGTSTAGAIHLSTKFSPLRANIPWDVLSAIIQHADTPTLKTLSLVSRDFLIESAPALCLSFTLRVAPNADLHSSHNSSYIWTATRLLRRHTRRRYITSIRIVLHGTLEEHDDPLAQTSLSLSAQYLSDLVSVIARVERLESLELDVWHHQYALGQCLEETPLPLSLKRLNVVSFGPIWPAIGAAFWERHAPHLTSLELHAPLAIMVPGFPKSSFASLEHLHTVDTNFLDPLRLPDSLKSLVVEQLCAEEDFTALRDALVDRSGLEHFSFQYAGGGDPLIAYTALAEIPALSTLRTLSIVHGDFPSTVSVSAAAEALARACPSLEELEWTMGDVSLISLGYALYGRVGKALEVAKAFGQGTKLRRVVLRLGETGNIDVGRRARRGRGEGIVIVRHGASWMSASKVPIPTDHP